jgi:hypothetical protein
VNVRFVYLLKKPICVCGRREEGGFFLRAERQKSTLNICLIFLNFLFQEMAQVPFVCAGRHEASALIILNAHKT